MNISGLKIPKVNSHKTQIERQPHKPKSADQILIDAAKKHGREFDGVNEAIQQLADIGKEYKNHEAVDAEHRSQILASAARITLSAIKAGQRKALTKSLRKKLNRRRYKGQDTMMLVLELGVGLTRTTASRYASLGRYLIHRSVAPENFVEKIKEIGSLTSAITKAQKWNSKKKPTRKTTADIKITLAAKVKGRLDGMKTGSRMVVALVQKNDSGIRIAGVSRDATLSRLATLLFEQGSLKDLDATNFPGLKLKKAKLKCIPQKAS